MFLAATVVSLAVAQIGPARPTSDNPGINRFDNSNSLNVKAIIRADVAMSFAASRIHIELSNSTSSYFKSQYADEQGEARFFDLPEGSYTMKITGSIHESGREYSFTLNYADPQHVEIIRVHFKSDGSGDSARSGNLATANQLTAPSKALDEMAKAKTAFDKKQYEEAKKHYEAAIAIFPNYGSALNGLGVVSEMFKDDDSAKRYYEKAMEADPASPEPYLNMGKFASAHQDFLAAEKILTKYLTLESRSGEGLLLLTNAQVMNGHYDDAVGNAKAVLALNEKQFVFAHVLAAIALEGKNLYPKAIEEYQAYLKIKPDSDKAPAIRQAILKLESHISNP